MVEPAGDTPLPPLPADAEKTIYLRKESGEYEALVTAANVTSHTKFSYGPEHPEDIIVDLLAASPDLTHIIIEGRVGLTSMAGDEGGLYEWSAGQLQLVSILPGGTPAPAAGTAPGHENQTVRKRDLDGWLAGRMDKRTFPRTVPSRSLQMTRHGRAQNQDELGRRAR